MEARSSAFKLAVGAERRGDRVIVRAAPVNSEGCGRGCSPVATSGSQQAMLLQNRPPSELADAAGCRELLARAQRPTLMSSFTTIPTSRCDQADSDDGGYHGAGAAHAQEAGAMAHALHARYPNGRPLIARVSTQVGGWPMSSWPLTTPGVAKAQVGASLQNMRFGPGFVLDRNNGGKLCSR